MSQDRDKHREHDIIPPTALVRTFIKEGEIDLKVDCQGKGKVVHAFVFDG